MKINKLFHWLYAFLMGLPLLSSLWIGLIWTFNENSQVPTITENVSREVDFNQLFDIDTNAFTSANLTINKDVESYTYTFSGTPSVDIYLQYYLPNNLSGHVLIFQTFVYNENIAISYLNFPFVQLGYPYNRSRVTLNTQNVFVLKFFANQSINITAQFQIFDLTQMFGAGNEPTLSQFNTWFDSVYKYDLSEHIVIEDYSTTQVLDSPVNYIWLPSFGGIGWTIQNVFNSMVNGMFGLATSYGIGLTIVKLLTYWLCISLIWLIYDVIMYVPLMIHRWLDKGVIS